MIMIVQILLIALIIFSAIFVLLYPISSTLYFTKIKRQRHPLDFYPSITIMIPVKGLDVQALENFSSMYDQNYPGKYDILYCVESDDDPCVSVIRKIICLYPKIESRLAFSGQDHEFIGKMHNLAACLPLVKNDIIVFIDSDARLVYPDSLKELAELLDVDGIGLVTCHQACYDSQNISAALIALLINSDLLGYFSFLAVAGKLNFANGATMAVKRSILEKSGGLIPLRNRVLNDTAIARRILALDKRIMLASFPAHIHMGESTLIQWWNQTHRWHVGMKSFMSWPEYCAFGATRSGLFCAIISVTLFPGIIAGLYLISGVLLARTISLFLVNLLHVKDKSTWKYFPLIYILDLLDIIFWISPFISNRVSWRGRRYKIYRKGEAVLQK